ncbi:unnamed protein product [Pedinophyceae sp. YPF-701]|nr:unnamed protein product [Pedinophyceae sp. YPF-701]
MALKTTMKQGGTGLFGTGLFKKAEGGKPATLSKKAGTAKKAPPKKAAPKPVFKAKKTGTTTTRTSGTGGVGYRKFEGRPTWIPNADIPEWLDGSLPGDRGFDPLSLGKPVEYLQIDVDELDQNAAVNKPGQVVGTFQPQAEKVSSENKLQPYDEVFGLERFRECELIHGRWAMLAALGVIVAESATGVSWAEAGKVELDGAKYLSFDLPFSISQLCWIEAILMGGVEIYRSTELDTTKRCYPGGVFDPLGLAGPDADPEKAFRLKEAEIKHARLAMVAFFGFGVQYLTTGEGAFGSLAKFSATL